MKTTCLVVAVVLAAMIFVSSVQATVMGVDLGSEYFKVSAPKHNNIDIILNEQSHRKSANFIGFRSDERYFGEDAKNFAARFPDNMFSMVNRLVGVPASDKATVDWLRNQMHHTFTVEPFGGVASNYTRLYPDDPAGDGLQLKTGSNPVVAHSAESLQAMLLNFIAQMTTKDAKMKSLSDCVLTVPGFFTRRQRQALVNAGKLAGLNVVALMHPTTAAALQFGMQGRGFGETTKTILIYDMGATKTDVGIYTFSPPVPPKDPKKKIKNSEALGVLTSRALVSNPNLGGRSFDSCIAKHLEDRFVAETKLPRVLDGDTLQKRKAIVSLMRAANKAKEMLSANKKAPVTVEGMAPERDFNTHLTREEFEKACAPLFEEAKAMATRALAQVAGEITMDDLAAFELVGGGHRIPKIVEALSELRGKTVDRTLNADEAMALGAGYYGGIVANKFRIKSFAVKEPLLADPSESVTFSLSPRANHPDEKPAIRPLFPAGTHKGSRKSISLNRTTDFAINVYHTKTSDEGEQTHELDFVLNVSQIDAALNKHPYFAIPDPESDSKDAEPMLNHPNNSHTVRIELRAGETGLVTVEGTEIRVNFVKNVTKKIKVNLTDEEIEEARTKAREAAEKAATAAEEAKKLQQEANKTEEKAPAADAENATATNATSSDDSDDTDAKEEADEKKDEPAAEEKPAEVKPKEDASPEDQAKELQARLDRIKARVEAAAKKVKTYKMEKKQVEELKRKVSPLTSALAYGPPHVLNRDEIDEIEATLRALDAVDKVKRETAHAKNDLEAYVLSVKTDGLLENSIVAEKKLMTEDEEKSIRETVEKVSDWLDDEGSYDDVTKEQFEAKKDELKEVCKAVTKKLKAEIKAEQDKIKKEEKPKTNKSKKGGKKGNKAEPAAEGEETPTDGEEKSKADGGEKKENRDETMDDL